MRYALIIAGGSGTRLWPMSTRDVPKQLIPFIGPHADPARPDDSHGDGASAKAGEQGKSLLRIAMDRLVGLIPEQRIYICAGEGHRQAILDRLPDFDAGRFIGEPEGRDTLNAVGLGAAVIGEQDADAVVGVFTADHLIEPIEQFQHVVEKGYQIAEAHDPVLVTFGVEPTYPATAYGYLELGQTYGGGGASVVRRFKEKPDEQTARRYHEAGPTHYLWNSGMFVWRARTLMQCMQKYRPANYEGLARIAADWHTPRRDQVLHETYPQLEKISVDYAVMEPASRDPQVDVAATPMPLKWLDVGSWPSFAAVCPSDAAGNATSAGRHAMVDSTNTLVASEDPEHLIATVGVDDLIVVHTAKATLVCRADQAQKIKELHKLVGEKFGEEML